MLVWGEGVVVLLGGFFSGFGGVDFFFLEIKESMNMGFYIQLLRQIKAHNASKKKISQKQS